MFVLFVTHPSFSQIMEPFIVLLVLLERSQLGIVHNNHFHNFQASGAKVIAFKMTLRLEIN
jgi:hypothetical protein